MSIQASRDKENLRECLGFVFALFCLVFFFFLSKRMKLTVGKYSPLQKTPLTVVTILDHREEAKNALLSDFVLEVKDISIF